MILWRCGFLSLLLSVFSTQAYNVLLVFPIPGRSLSLLGEAFVRHLLNDGHEVTLITAFPMKSNPSKNLKQIDVSSTLNIMVNEIYTISYLIDHKEESVDQVKLQQIGMDFSRVALEHENVQELLRDTTQKFDVVVADLFENELYASFAAYYDCPMIWSYSVGVDWGSMKLMHGPTNPAYTVDYVSENLLPLTLYQRVQELWTQLYGMFIERFYMASQKALLYEKIFAPLFAKKGKPMPAFESLVYNSSLMFGNIHHAMGNIPPVPQSFKLIGGFHIDTPAKPLPENIQRLMDNAKHGVIYFSMGSVFKSETMPKWLVEDLLNLFGEFKQTVLWKFEADLNNLPSNVHTIKWAPQHSILAHPNCLMFITHGGLLSSTEAIHFGVPTVGIPVFMDQFVNVRKAAAKGYAIKVDLSRHLTKDLRVAIQDMLGNPSYRAKVKELSAIYHARPVSPGKELAYWVRHVVETRGAQHLRSPALMMPWYQKLYVDFIALVLLVVLAVWNLVKVACCGRKKVRVGKKRD